MIYLVRVKADELHRFVRSVLVPLGRMTRLHVPIALEDTHPDLHPSELFSLVHRPPEGLGDVGVVVNAMGVVLFERHDLEVDHVGDDPAVKVLLRCELLDESGDRGRVFEGDAKRRLWISRAFARQSFKVLTSSSCEPSSAR